MAKRNAEGGKDKEEVEEETKGWSKGSMKQPELKQFTPRERNDEGNFDRGKAIMGDSEEKKKE